MMLKQTTLVFGALTACMSLLLCHGPARSTSQDMPYDWTVEVNTQQLERQFDYPGSTIAPVVKTELQYYSMAAPENKTKYEHIWYGNGKPLGLERLHRLDITQGDGISIRIVHKHNPPAYDEHKAAANAILRVLVDAYLNRSPVVSVRLPLASFDTIAGQLRTNPRINTAADGADRTVDSGVPIFVQSEPAGRTLQLYYFQS